MGLQVSGTSVDGGTLVVDCRISINMASLTLEQVAGKVPPTHVASMNLLCVASDRVALTHAASRPTVPP